jgi:hypothetical protein
MKGIKDGFNLWTLNGLYMESSDIIRNFCIREYSRHLDMNIADNGHLELLSEKESCHHFAMFPADFPLNI